MHSQRSTSGEMAATIDVSSALTTAQPVPVAVDVAHIGNYTVIQRDWQSAYDPMRCRLCPYGTCSARGRDRCVVIINRYVADEEAALFAATECRRPPTLQVVAEPHA